MNKGTAYDPEGAAGRVTTLVRMAFGGKPETGPFEGMSETDWNATYIFASRQGLLAVTYDGTAHLPERLSPPKKLLLQWGVNASLVEERYSGQMAAIEKLARLYTGHSIEILLLKGYGLSLYYPVPQHREWGDMDIYLMGDFEMGNRIVEEAGIKVTPAIEKHSTFVFDGILVENHKIFVNETRNRAMAAIEAFLENMTSLKSLREAKVGEACVWLPSPDFNAVYLLGHASSHFSSGELALRNLCDWARFLTQEGARVDRKLLANILERYRLSTFFGLMTGFCERHLGLAPQGWPSPGSELEYRFDESVFRYRTVPLPEHETFLHGVRRIWKTRWRHREVMHTDFLTEVFYRARKLPARLKNK